MAKAGDGKPRSEVRRSSHQVNVRLTAEEWNQLQAQADEWNRHLPQNASKHARMTIPHLMRTAALRRKRPPSVLTVGLSAEALVEFRAARADMARLGNMFKAWLEYGPGVLRGKGGAPLKIHRGAMGVERLAVQDILKGMDFVAQQMAEAIKDDG
jgi:hypothetical protein